MNEVQVPAQIEHWVKEMLNPRNNDFQRDLYRQRLEQLQQWIEKKLAESKLRLK